MLSFYRNPDTHLIMDLRKQMPYLQFFLRDSIKKLGNFTRWMEWYDSKLPFVGIGYILVVVGNQQGEFNEVLVLQVAIFSGFYLAFGYAYNDWTDRVIDQDAGKLNTLGRLSFFRATLLLIGLVIGSLASVWQLLGRIDILIAIFLSYGFAFAYSAPYIRLKEHGWLGLLSASIAQRCLPCLILFIAIDCISDLSIVYILLMLVVGLRWMIIHQLIDLDSDQRSQVQTYTAHVGYHTAQKWLPIFLFFEIALIAYISVRIIYHQPLSLGIILVYAGVTAFMTRTTGETWWQMLEHPPTAYLVLLDFYFLYWPLGLMIVWAVREPVKSPYFLLLIVWLSRHIRQHIQDLYGLWRA